LDKAYFCIFSLHPNTSYTDPRYSCIWNEYSRRSVLCWWRSYLRMQYELWLDRRPHLHVHRTFYWFEY